MKTTSRAHAEKCLAWFSKHYFSFPEVVVRHWMTNENSFDCMSLLLRAQTPYGRFKEMDYNNSILQLRYFLLIYSSSILNSSFQSNVCLTNNFCSTGNRCSTELWSPQEKPYCGRRDSIKPRLAVAGWDPVTRRRLHFLWGISDRSGVGVNCCPLYCP